MKVMVGEVQGEEKEVRCFTVSTKLFSCTGSLLKLHILMKLNFPGAREGDGQDN